MRTLGLSRKDFGDNFVTTKINRMGTTIFVQVEEDTFANFIYTNKTVLEGILYLFYVIPKKFLKDTQYVLKGQYSKMSDKAKRKIIKGSGLVFNKKTKDGNRITSKLLYALSKNEVLLDYYFDQLATNVSKYDRKLYKTLQNVELMECVDESDFIDEDE